MRWLLAPLVVLTLAVAACDGLPSVEPTAPTATTSPTSSSTSPTTTLSPTSTTQTPSTTIGAGLELELRGSHLVYSSDGAIVVSGWVDRPAEVIVGDRSAITHTEPGGRTSFEVDITLQPGEDHVQVVAQDGAGARATQSLTVIVDLSLEEQLAFIQDIDLQTMSIVADYAEMLTGEEAVIAAREDGFLGDGEDLPGDFYIRNRNPRLRTLSLSVSPVVVLNACYPDEGPCLTEESVDVETWERIHVAPESAEKTLGWSWYGAGELPYRLTSQDDVVVQAIEQYLP